LRQRLSVSHGLGLLLAIATTIALSAALLRGGYVNPEAETFIPHYLANAPLMGILFDPAHNDWGSYQARELSYVFDWIDCRFLVFSAAAGFPHFLSLTHYAGAALIAIAIWTFSQRALRLGPAASMALVGLWLTSPCVLLGGNFYRSAKIVSSAALVGASIGAWLHIHAKGRSPGSRCTAVAFALSLVLAGLADRQGFFLGAFLAVWLLALGLMLRDRRTLVLAAAGAVAVVIVIGYTYAVGPWLVMRYSGRPVSFEYMSLPLMKTLSEPGQIAQIAVYSTRAAFEGIGATFGGLPWMLAGVAFVALAWALKSACPGAPDRGRGEAPAWWFAAPIAAVVIMYAAMAMRHFAVVKFEDFILVYYPLPSAAMSIVGIGAAAARFVGAARLGRGRVAALFWILLASNLCNLPHYRLLLDTGCYRDSISAGPAARVALKNGKAFPGASPAVVAILKAQEISATSRP
jgi:hypothetical protein